MRRSPASISAILGLLLLIAGTGFADPQGSDESPRPSFPRHGAAAPLVPSNQVLELAPLIEPKLPPAPPPIARPVIPSPFLGCWEATPDKFDEVVDSVGSVTIGSPGEIIFCYHENRIEVPEAKIHFGVGDWTKNILLHMGLGLTLAKLEPAGITTDIYAITNNQIHARTFVPMKVTEMFLWIIPISNMYTLTDEELATAESADVVRIEGRQEISVPGAQSVRMWHADFHRVAYQPSNP